MSVVVNMTEYRSKGVLTLARELLVAASKGKILGLRVEVQWKDGKRKECAAGAINHQGEPDEDCIADHPCTRRLR